MSVSLGQYLRDQRLSKNRSLEEIAETTKILKAYLQAIEEDDYDKLPAETFAKGFIRAYAIALGLDPEDVLQRYHDYVETSTEPLGRQVSYAIPVTKMTIKTQKEKRMAQLARYGVVFAIGLVVVVIAAFLLYHYVNKTREFWMAEDDHSAGAVAQPVESQKGAAASSAVDETTLPGVQNESAEKRSSAAESGRKAIEVSGPTPREKEGKLLERDKSVTRPAAPLIAPVSVAPTPLVTPVRTAVPTTSSGQGKLPAGEPLKEKAVKQETVAAVGSQTTGPKVPSSELVIFAKGDARISYKKDGETEQVIVLKQGEKRQLEVVRSIDISVDKTNAVDLTFNKRKIQFTGSTEGKASSVKLFNLMR